MNKIVDTLWHRVLRRPYQLAATDVGQGRVVVLLHGLGADSAVWRPLTKKLKQDRWRVITIDLLGFGASPHPAWSKYTARDHAKAVIATLKSLGIKDEPVALVGHSLGGLVAAHIAATYPDKVSRLVLYTPPLFVDVPEYKRHVWLRGQYFKLFEYIVAHPGLVFLQQRWLWRIIRRLSGIHLTEERWLAFERSLRNTIMEQKTYEELQNISVPTDIVQGRLDFIVIRAGIKNMFASNRFITIHAVNYAHDITPRAARFITRLLESPYETGKPKILYENM